MTTDKGMTEMTDSPKPGTPLPWNWNRWSGKVRAGQGVNAVPIGSFAGEKDGAYSVHAANEYPALLAERDIQTSALKLASEILQEDCYGDGVGKFAKETALVSIRAALEGRRE